MQNRASTLPPCLNRMYLHRQLGAKVCRKVCKFICQTICCSFGRYRRLGKARSHLQGGPPTRYQNKVQQNSSTVEPVIAAGTAILAWTGRQQLFLLSFGSD